MTSPAPGAGRDAGFANRPPLRQAARRVTRVSPNLLRHGTAVAAGLLLALAFPGFELAGLAWVAPGLMLAAAAGTTRGDAFRLGYLAGLTFWLASLYWLLLIPATGFPILGWVALAAYLALFQGVWVWLCWRCVPDGGEPTSTNPLPAARIARLRWALLCAVLWVALEMLRARLLSGFPWSLLGVSQFALTPLLQISAVTGVYGVSFLVAWTSVSFFCAARQLFQPGVTRGTLAAETAVPLLVVAVVFATGYHTLTRPAGETRTLRVTVVQPAIPQTMIWDPSANEERFARLLELTERALTNETDLLLWPEAALPELNEASYTALTNLAAQHAVWFLFGADDVQLRPGATSETDVQFFNAAWLLSPRGLVVDVYHKRRLVIFGEYVPLARWLPVLKWLTPITGAFTPGRSPTQFPLRDLDLHAAPLICFEDVFPHGVRGHVTNETSLLINLTNDGWFGDSAAQRQHAANALFRAIENGVPLVRACNNGLSCWVDERGRLREILRDDRGGIHGPGFATFTVELPAAAAPRPFYQRHGDVFGWACVVLGALAVAKRTVRRKSQA